MKTPVKILVAALLLLTGLTTTPAQAHDRYDAYSPTILYATGMPYYSSHSSTTTYYSSGTGYFYIQDTRYVPPPRVIYIAPRPVRYDYRHDRNDRHNYHRRDNRR